MGNLKYKVRWLPNYLKLYSLLVLLPWRWLVSPIWSKRCPWLLTNLPSVPTLALTVSSRMSMINSVSITCLSSRLDGNSTNKTSTLCNLLLLDPASLPNRLILTTTDSDLKSIPNSKVPSILSSISPEPTTTKTLSNPAKNSAFTTLLNSFTITLPSSSVSTLTSTMSPS